ncbi:hypothetical protein BFS06_11890 [Clostridium perfringens]|uniref:Putative ATPase n=1 Tax=Clostridium perfringens TaxID=1502 RepID=A0A140GS81_CLOPF|nr:hypothetical protein [Clostridium perfringens]AMN31390.1 putative ATPase [Clostridium perfringens]TBX14904.1 hypothetical protein BFS06_11890 [Clostridium perfringens]
MKDNINNAIELLVNKINKDRIVKETLNKQLIEKGKEIEELEGKRDEILLKKELLIEASKEAKEGAKKVLEDVNTNAIQYIFGSDLSVKVSMDDKKGAEISILSKENNDGIICETDPANEEGGGLADVVSLCSFNSITQLVGQNNKAPLFLDEPTKFVSKGEYSSKVTDYLKDISQFTGKQVFLVTHDEYLSNIGEKTFRIKKENDISKVEELIQ